MVLADGRLGWAGAARVFLATVFLAWTAAFCTLWLEAPIVVQQPEVGFPPGAAVASALALLTFGGQLVVGVSAVVLAFVVSQGYRAVATLRISRLGRACASGTTLGLCTLAVVALGVATELDASERVPLDRYPEALPVVQSLEGSRCASLEKVDGELRLVSEACDWPHEYCEVNAIRQHDDAPCGAFVVQRDAVSNALLVSARTKAGLAPIVWCLDTAGADCPHTLSALDVRGAVTIPLAWRLVAMLGVAIAFICVGTGWRALNWTSPGSPVTSADAHGLKLDFVHRVCVVALAVVLAMATPLLAALALGFR
jgi:hypothetical protein